MLKIFFFVAMLDDPIAATLVKNHIDGKIYARGTYSGGVESQAAHFESKTHGILIFEGPVENGFAITRRADDLIGCALADLNPIPLRVDKKELVFFIVGELSADQRRKIKGQAAFLQRSLVLLGHPADLRGKKIDRFEQVVERFLMLRHRFFEVSHRFVSQ